MDNGELKMENVAILARVPSALRRGAPLCGDNSQFSILHSQFSITQPVMRNNKGK
ncbi:MAG: hypothetical protein ACLVFA_06150 [Butyricicoccus sp.]